MPATYRPREYRALSCSPQTGPSTVRLERNPMCSGCRTTPELRSSYLGVMQSTLVVERRGLQIFRIDPAHIWLADSEPAVAGVPRFDGLRQHKLLAGDP